MSQEDVTYKALDFDGTERRANYRMVAYRIDILHALDKKDAAAIIFQIIYRWLTEFKRDEALKEIEKRKKQGLPPCTQDEIENMLWVRMSYNDFVRESGGAVAYNTVIRMLDYLLDTKKVLERRPSTEPQHADFEYRINKERVIELLKELPSAPAFTAKWSKKKKDSTQMGTPVEDALDDSDSTQMGTDSTQVGILSTQMGTALYPNGYPTHTTHIPPHITHREDTAHVSDDNAPLTQSSQSSLSASEESKQAVSYSQKSTPDTSSSKVETKKNDAPKPPTEKQGKANGKGSRTVELTPEQSERRRKWQDRINENRGGPLRKKGECINETLCLAELVCEFDDEQIEFVFTYAITKHWKFKDNPHEVGGKDIHEMSRPVVKLMKDVKSKDSPNEQETFKNQKESYQRKTYVETGPQLAKPQRLTREQLKATEREAV